MLNKSNSRNSQNCRKYLFKRSIWKKCNRNWKVWLCYGLPIQQSWSFWRPKITDWSWLWRRLTKQKISFENCWKKNSASNKISSNSNFRGWTTSIFRICSRKKQNCSRSTMNLCTTCVRRTRRRTGTCTWTPSGRNCSRTVTGRGCRSWRGRGVSWRSRGGHWGGRRSSLSFWTGRWRTYWWSCRVW